tara:strand:+ start:262 stop:405 length:144 start_codon:yes stop_codon:yes gene_type:complete
MIWGLPVYGTVLQPNRAIAISRRERMGQQKWLINFIFTSINSIEKYT